MYLRLNTAFRDKVVKRISTFLRSKKIKFDGFVGRGISGVTIASILSHTMKKNLVIVRKSIHNNHSGNLVEGLSSKQNRLIIIDDFVETGKTIEKIEESIQDDNVKILGAIFYNQISPKRCVQSIINPKVLLKFHIPFGKRED